MLTKFFLIYFEIGMLNTSLGNLIPIEITLKETGSFLSGKLHHYSKEALFISLPNSSDPLSIPYPFILNISYPENLKQNEVSKENLKLQRIILKTGEELIGYITSVSPSNLTLQVKNHKAEKQKLTIEFSNIQEILFSSESWKEIPYTSGFQTLANDSESTLIPGRSKLFHIAKWDFPKKHSIKLVTTINNIHTEQFSLSIPQKKFDPTSLKSYLNKNLTLNSILSNETYRSDDYFYDNFINSLISYIEEKSLLSIKNNKIKFHNPALNIQNWAPENKQSSITLIFHEKNNLFSLSSNQKKLFDQHLKEFDPSLVFIGCNGAKLIAPRIFIASSEIQAPLSAQERLGFNSIQPTFILKNKQQLSGKILSKENNNTFQLLTKFGTFSLDEEKIERIVFPLNQTNKKTAPKKSSIELQLKNGSHLIGTFEFSNGKNLLLTPSWNSEPISFSWSEITNISFL